jgi:hypothetical protein
VDLWGKLSVSSDEESFLISHGGLVEMFIPVDSLAKIRSVQGEYEKAGRHVLKAIESSIGKSMFGHAAGRVLWSLYIQKIEVKLIDLEQVDYLATEVTAFNTLMAREAVILKRLGARIYEEKLSTMPFLATPVPLKLVCPEDEYIFRLNAAMKTVGINSGCIDKLPWEAICIDFPLAGVREHCKVPSFFICFVSGFSL